MKEENETDRIALVVGNSDYKCVKKLKNPNNDANDIGDILKTLGFSVKKYFDLSIDEMNKVTREFLIDMNEFSTGLFFYAGHGMQIDGLNYLVPIDCKLTDKEKTIFSCFNINGFLKQVEKYKGKTNICILDACRNNPFVSNDRSITSGFVPFVSQPKGSIIAFSTSSDSTALDGEGSNGLYTSALKESLLIPNLKIEDVFKSTRIKVLELSGGEQLSWEHSCLVGDFYFSVKETSVVSNIEDVEIFNFVEERSSFYQSKTDNIYDIECMPYVDAYNKFKIPVIQIVRAFFRINYKKNNQCFNDSTIDEINIGYLESWGFYRENGRWYYKNHYVEMGDPLPLPEELLPLKPVHGCKIEITGDMQCNNKEGKLYFTMHTSFPDETPVIFSLKGRDYSAQSSGKVLLGSVSSDGFSNKGDKLLNGLYKISVSCPIYDVLPDSVKTLVGEKNRNMVGKNVRYNPIGGNIAEISFNVMVRDEETYIV